MRTKAICKKALSLAIALTMVATFCISALAEDTTATGTGALTDMMSLDASISPTTISITHPMSISYTVDPNTGTVTAADVNITNNSVAAITVTITSLKAVKGCITDVLPDAKDWNNLSNVDSPKYIALGLTAKSGGWAAGYSTMTYYSANTTPALIGTLAPGSIGTLTFSALYGKSFKTGVSIQHMMCFQFNLA